MTTDSACQKEGLPPDRGGGSAHQAQLVSLLAGICIGCIGVALGLHFSTNKPEAVIQPLNGTVTQVLGVRGALLFNSLDVNGDGNLTSSEFGTVVEKLTGEAPPILMHSRADGETGDAVTLFTDFLPLMFESMKMYEDEGLDGMMRNFKNMVGLRHWTTAHKSDSSFYSRDFKLFLPKAGDESVGRSYWLYNPHLEPWHQGDNKKYYPPNPEGKEAIIYQLMRMLHPRPFLLTRFGPYGSAAVVQAVSDEFYKIRFRLHVEFQVNEPPQLPFWYTPAQLTGHLVFSKNGLHLKEFNLYLPADRKLNIDMEWITTLENAETGETENVEVEIGYQPKMEIHTMNVAAPDYDWKEKISDEEAESILEKHFYPFKKVSYLPLADAFDRASAEDKLVHAIVLWGSLDDQSC